MRLAPATKRAVRYGPLRSGAIQPSCLVTHAAFVSVGKDGRYAHLLATRNSDLSRCRGQIVHLAALRLVRQLQPIQRG